MTKVPSLGRDDKGEAAAIILGEVEAIFMEWFETEAAQLGEQDMDAMELAVQRLLRLEGGALMARLLTCAGQEHELSQPACTQCGQPMRRVAMRGKQMQGLVGDFFFERPYFQCRSCGGGFAAEDERLGVGPGSYTPALSRVAAALAADVPFARSTTHLRSTLGATFNEADVYRSTEALGIVAEVEIQAEIQAQAAAPDQTVSPAGDTLLVGVDGTTSLIDADWREVKVGIVGTLGPDLSHDTLTGRDLFALAGQRYCAAVKTPADEFFPRLGVLARQAGWGHPSLRRIVCISDGGAWIMSRMAMFDQPGVERIEILDYMHASEHVGKVAAEFFGEGSLDAHAWMGPILTALKEQGTEPLFKALEELRPRTQTQKEELRRAKHYFTVNLDRMRYPDFIAMHLPIASGAVEATCRSLVCQRTKDAGMRWTRLGAQAVLNLRCLHLSRSDGWSAFFARHPLRRKPPVATLRKPAMDAA